MWFYRYRTSLGFSAAVSQIANEFFRGFQLCAGRLISVEIAYETNAQRDVVEIIAVHMATVYLAPPAIAHFDLAIAGGCAVPNYEVISEAVLHAPNMLVIIIKDTRIALTRPAVVHNNELPPTPFYRRSPNCIDNRTC